MRQSDPLHDPGRFQQDHESFPVHLIGLTQPHGVLMVLMESTFTIVQVSGNTLDHLGVSSQTLLGQSVLDLLAPSTVQTSLQQRLQTCTEHSSYIPVNIALADSIKRFDGLIHRINGSIILELEPADLLTDLQTAPQILQSNLHQAIARLRSINDITDFLQTAVTEIQALTDYDRVMVYQFDEHNAGSVVAEVKPPEEVTYLGLHYPATDIPTLVRQLYQQNMVRFIPDLTAPPIELIAIDQSDQPSLDLRHAILRGVDPCCIEYHQNMGVAALLVIALVKDSQLWGLISCHHQTPKFLPYSVRSACEVLGQLVAAELGSKVDRTELNYLNNLQAIQADFVNSIAKAENFKQALIEPAPRLLDVVSAQGAAVCLDQDITLIGNTPALEEVQALIKWSTAETSTEIFYTDCLSDTYPAAATFKATASGLIVLKISQFRRYLILWFRPEVLQTVHWAGDPRLSTQQTDEGQVVLCPRASFEQWQETVQATALPWHTAEIANAVALKNAIVGIVLKKADELAQINLELERSNHELDSFAYAASHDLKEPLRGITNFSSILLKRHSQSLDESGVKRLKTLVKLAERMDGLIDALLKFSRLGQAALHFQPTDLNILVPTVVDMLQAGREDSTPSFQIQIPRPLPTVSADPILITEVFSNLLSNALKYTDKPQPLVEIGYLTDEERQNRAAATDIAPDTCIIYVQDDGIGIQERHFQNIFRLFKRLHERDSYGGGTGVGLTIAKKIIERHGGRIWVESNYGEKTTFYFVLNCKEK
ncbi:MAG: ATP-binding protein [Cyanobacteria bacterium P01_H01_bin.105]